MSVFVGFVADFVGFVADFVGFVADFVCQFSEFGNGKKDGCGTFSILNGKTLRRAS